MLGGQHEMSENTPSASADATAMAFETVLYYGQAMARVKVQQGLVILKAELNNGALGATALADLKQDIVAHMLVTTYQSAIHAAYQMGLGGADVATAQAAATDAWSLIQDNWAGSQDDKGRLASLFDVQTPPTGQHYCTASVLLTRNLPASSSNHYGSADADGAGRPARSTWPSAWSPRARTTPRPWQAGLAWRSTLRRMMTSTRAAPTSVLRTSAS